MLLPFGPYVLEDKLAEGGMAEVYLARGHPDGANTSSPCVIKCVAPHLRKRTDVRELFAREVAITMRVQHPGVVRALDQGVVEGVPFLALEWIPGPHLGALFAHSLRVRRPLPIAACVHVVLQVARALDAVHRLREVAVPGASFDLPPHDGGTGLVHGDVSPQNVLVTPQGDVRLIDFGVSLWVGEGACAQPRLRGKMGYLSPEHCRGEPLSAASDVFSLGVVLYELLTRRRLYREADDQRAMQRLVFEAPRPPSAWNPHLDPELDALVLRALAKEPRQRHADMQTFAAGLAHWLGVRVSDEGSLSLRRWWQQWATALPPTFGTLRAPGDSAGAPLCETRPAPVEPQLQRDDRSTMGRAVGEP